MRKFVKREEEVGYTTVGFIKNHSLIRLLFDKRGSGRNGEHIIVKGTIL